jgi:hypothetical protein
MPRLARPFAREWSTPGGPLSPIPYVDFEFDLVDDQIPAPWVGPAMEPNLSQGVRAIHEGRLHESGQETGFALAQAVLRHLPNAAPGKRLMTRLATCYSSLPPRASINHLTALPSRPVSPAAGIRLIASLPRGEVARYLRQVKWQGDVDCLNSTLDAFAPYATQVDFDLNLNDDDAGDRISFYHDARPPRLRDSHLALILDRLATRDCVPATFVQALREWFGKVQTKSDRGLTLKIGLRNNGEIEAKAYLSGRLIMEER